MIRKSTLASLKIPKTPPSQVYHHSDFDITLDKGYPSVSFPSILKHKDTCQFLPTDQGPTPVIILSLGRSGSSVIWNTLARIANPKNPNPNKAVEITGRVQSESKHFFESIPDELGSQWASLYLCGLQNNSTRLAHEGTDGIVGFQWKPYNISFHHKYAEGALGQIASVRDPTRIRVIYITRNPIDRKLSNLRQMKENHLDAHCAVGDEDCAKEYLKVELPTGKRLLNWLQKEDTEMNIILGMLRRSGIKHTHVSYSLLFNDNAQEVGNESREWEKMLDLISDGEAGKKELFMGAEGRDPLTMTEVREHISSVKTSSMKRKDKIANFEDVRLTLKGTEFSHYLHGN